METTETETGLLSRTFARLVAEEMINILDQRRAERAEQTRQQQWEQFLTTDERVKFEEALRLSQEREARRVARLSPTAIDSEAT